MNNVHRLLFGCTLVCSATISFAAPRDLHGSNWAGKNLENENLNGANLADATLKGANLRNATLKHANLSSADLSGATLREADLTEADLHGAKLANAVLQDAKFEKANLQGDDVFLAYGNATDPAKIKTAQRMSDYSGAPASNLVEHNGNISFKEANLQYAKIHGSLEDVDFHRADLRGADLSDTKDAAKAQWQGAIYDGNTRWPRGFDAAEARAKRGEASANDQSGAGAANSSFTGKWHILPESGGAATDGALTIRKNGTFTWIYSTNADPAEGTWKAVSGGIVLSKGETGADWTGSIKSHGKYESALQLRSTGKLERWGAPAGPE